LEDYLHNIFDFEENPTSIEVHSDQWPEILNSVYKGCIYFPGLSTSASGDLYVFWNDSLLSFQYKAGNQQITPSVLVSEAQKTILPSILLSKYKICFVIAGNISSELKIKENINSMTIRFSENDIIQYKQKIEGKMQFMTYKVPINAEILLLTSKGMNWFFSSQNSDLFKL